MFCAKCGSELDSDAKFCNFCGANLKNVIGTKESNSSIPKETIQTVTIGKEETRPQAEVKQDIAALYPDFFTRSAAWLIDIIIIGLIMLILFIFFHRIIWAFPWFFHIPLIVISFLYFWGLESFNNGQTIGKKALKIRTVDEETLQPTTLENNLLNNLFKCHFGLLIIDFLIGFLSNSGGPQKRLRIMQNVSKTVVIKSN